MGADTGDMGRAGAGEHGMERDRHQFWMRCEKISVPKREKPPVKMAGGLCKESFRVMASYNLDAVDGVRVILECDEGLDVLHDPLRF